MIVMVLSYSLVCLLVRSHCVLVCLPNPICSSTPDLAYVESSISEFKPKCDLGDNNEHFCLNHFCWRHSLETITSLTNDQSDQ